MSDGRPGGRGRGRGKPASPPTSPAVVPPVQVMLNADVDMTHDLKDINLSLVGYHLLGTLGISFTSMKKYGQSRRTPWKDLKYFILFMDSLNLLR